MTSYRKAYLLKQRYAARMLKQRGVHGIGVGFKDPTKPRKGAAIIVYADAATAASAGRKRRKSRSAPAVVLPSKLKSTVPVRIVRASRFRKNGTGGLKFRRRIRPVIAGYSVGSPNVSGTAGLIISDIGCPGSRYILSNNHVLVNENTDRSSATLQPGGADGGTVPRDQIGVMDRFVRLRKTRPNFLDAATSKPFRRSLLRPAYAVYGRVPGHVRTYKIGDKFKKVGRTTGAVTGTVESIHTDIRVDYGDYGGLGTITFKNQSVIRGKYPVSLGGDSGSVWLTKSGNLAAAVNFAGSDEGRLSIAYPVDWFMRVFNTRVASAGKRRLNAPGRGGKHKFMCVQPLSAKALKSLRPRKCRLGGKKTK
ncbi:hypothetical protein [Paenibacillus sanfengchensis]|uniref:hypothetical protein n=1 Tax=Paenibacillus sanfengchensis TaxID=3119819 RepID=UPI002FE3B8FF